MGSSGLVAHCTYLQESPAGKALIKSQELGQGAVVMVMEDSCKLNVQVS